jgi:hypothetical protein
LAFWVIIPDGKLGDIMATVAAVLEFPARKAHRGAIEQIGRF